ncbi:inositol-3-phosphate synthase [Candidatus Bathyarchaeota archaeon]|nr:inositol-3-phosphate synthase [Candidatus Bathyarchaeota archaeon]
MGEIRIAVAGIGNCCSSLIQGIYYYSKRKEKTGLLHENLGGYKISDIKFVAAFDISNEKVGKDLSKAIDSKPNQILDISSVPYLNVPVQMGIDLDNSDDNSIINIIRSKEKPVKVSEVLKNEKVDVFINLISGGSNLSSTAYAEEALKAGCAFLNATPASIASDNVLASKYFEAGIPLAGDDLLNQIGSTILHIGLLEFLNSRGVKVSESYQLDVGGGTESINTLEKTRDTKREIKTNTVKSHVPYTFPIVSGSTDFVDFLKNTRDSFFWIKGTYFGGANFSIDIKLSSVDANNGGSVLMDVIRGLKIATDKGYKGSIDALCSFGFKKSKQNNLVDSYRAFRDFIG